MNVKFTAEKTTKNTVRFAEVLNGPLDAPIVGTVYIPKSTLKELKWNEGDELTMSLSVTK